MAITRLVNHIILFYFSTCVIKIESSTGFAPSLELTLRSAHPVDGRASQLQLFLVRMEMAKKEDTVVDDPSVDGTATTGKEDCDSLLPKTSRQINRANEDEMKPFLDPGLLVADFLGIALACQLTGLLDVINNPEFTQAGGWFQPIPIVPPTLGVLVQHIAFVCSLWLCVVVATTMTTTATATASSTLRNSDESRNDDAVCFSLPTLLQQLLLFGILRGTIGLGLGQATPFALTDWTGILRDVYVVGLFLFALRFLYGQYFF
jgi:hypothetical protein